MNHHTTGDSTGKDVHQHDTTHPIPAQHRHIDAADAEAHTLPPADAPAHTHLHGDATHDMGHGHGAYPQREAGESAASDHAGALHVSTGHDRRGDGVQPGQAGATSPGSAAHGESHTAPPDSADHGSHVSHVGHEALFRKRFWVSVLLSIPVLVFSPAVQRLLGFTIPAFFGSAWIAPLFSLIVFLYGGVPFLQMAVPELRMRLPGMMTLVSLAITVALVYSMATLIIPQTEPFFWELVTLIDIMLLGHWLEMRSVRQASGALDTLAGLLPDTAERLLPDGSSETVLVSLLQDGDLLLVRPGTSIPADGVVVEGESDVNEAMITGESLPTSKAPGAQVIAGTINATGSLRVRVTATGERTALSGIMRLVEQAQQSKSPTQILADRAAGWLFYVALGTATLTAIVWIIATGMSVQVVERVATVLVIACPHALGLAVPLVVAITISLGARNGILIRDRLALEKLRDIDTIIFDKTGTLTRGEFGMVALATAEGWDQDRALGLAAAIEGDSEHTIARAIVVEAQERHLTLPSIGDFEAIVGRGVRATFEGGSVYVGGPRLLEMLKLEPQDAIARLSVQADGRGQSVVYLAQDDQIIAAFALADVIRDESRAAVRRLHAMGIEVAMLTGDSEAVAKTVAEELGIDQYFAQVLPVHKDQRVAELQGQGKRVAMVGDGVNDAPALTRADVGIAIGSGTDVAIESAGIILVRSNPLNAVDAIALSRASYRKMVQNLVWATGYNIVALPLAAGVLAPVGIILSPAVGALLMSLSTIVVALNAQLLRSTRLRT